MIINTCNIAGYNMVKSTGLVTMFVFYRVYLIMAVLQTRDGII